MAARNRPPPRDFPERFYAYSQDSRRLKAMIKKVEELRDAGKIRQAQRLVKVIEATALWRRVKEFETRMTEKPSPSDH